MPKFAFPDAETGLVTEGSAIHQRFVWFKRVNRILNLTKLSFEQKKEQISDRNGKTGLHIFQLGLTQSVVIFVE